MAVSRLMDGAAQWTTCTSRASCRCQCPSWSPQVAHLPSEASSATLAPHSRERSVYNVCRQERTTLLSPGTEGRRMYALLTCCAASDLSLASAFQRHRQPSRHICATIKKALILSELCTVPCKPDVRAAVMIPCKSQDIHASQQRFDHTCLV